MASGIFISYRRDDANHAAARLVDRLGRTYTREQLFFDIDNIAPGLDFKKVLSQNVEGCDVLLAIIGPRWLQATDGKGNRRLDNPRDFVRIEIEAALARDIRVIPLLVDGAQMPSEQDLPETLQPLVYRNAVRLAHERFGSEVDDLTKALSKIVPPSSQSASERADRTVVERPSRPHNRELEPSVSHSQNTPSRAPVTNALAFAVIALFATLFFALLLPSGDAAPYVLATSLIAVASGLAAVLIRRRGPSLTGTEAASYWFGTAGSCVVAAGPLFSVMQTASDAHLVGWLYAGVAFIVASIVLWLRWKRRHTV